MRHLSTNAPPLPGRVQSLWFCSGLILSTCLGCYFGNSGRSAGGATSSDESAGAAGAGSDSRTGGAAGTSTTPNPAGTAGTGGASFGEPTFSTNFTNLDGWHVLNRRGDGASIGILPHASSDDNATLGLVFPGNPLLGANDFSNPAYAVEVATTANDLYYGRYEVSVRFASCAADEEVVSGIFTYFNDGTDQNQNGIADNSEIDVELLCGEPHLLWLTVWTDYQTNPTPQFRKTTRVIDMRTGMYQQTRPGREGEYDVGPGGTVPGLSELDFPNPARFYVLGFDWQPSHVRYYIRLGDREVELFKLEGEARVPQRRGRFLLNLWHAPSHWLKGGSADYPKAPATMNVDWVRIWQ